MKNLLHINKAYDDLIFASAKVCIILIFKNIPKRLTFF